MKFFKYPGFFGNIFIVISLINFEKKFMSTNLKKFSLI